VITDELGSPILNSVLPAEIEWYIEMLKRGALDLSPEDLLETRTWLKAHSPR
jgi:hypothetical protein